MVLAVLAVGAAAASLAVGSQASNSAGHAKILRVGFVAPGAQCGAIGPAEVGDYCLGSQFYGMLTSIDPSTGKYIPNLAVSWKGKGRVWTFKLRPNARWSDGQPVTAADVVYSVQTAKDLENTTLSFFWTSLAEKIASAKAINRKTVQLTFKQFDYAMPNGDFAFSFAIIPQHFYGKSPGKMTVAEMNKISGGSGPFPQVGPYYLAHHSNQANIFMANPYWWGSKPKTPEIAVSAYASNDAMYLALKSNELDLEPGATNVNPKKLAPSVKVVLGPSPSTLSIAPYELNPKYPEFKSAAFRKALSLAVNRPLIGRLAYYGTAFPEGSVVYNANTYWHNPAVKADPYNPGLANKILDRLGFKKGSNGVRTANGHAMSYEVTAYNAENVQAEQLLTQEWKAIGIQMTFKNVDFPAFSSITRSKKYAFQFITFGTSVQGTFFIDHLAATSGSYAQPVYANGQYDYGYRDPAYDKLFNRLKVPRTPAQIRKIVFQNQTYLATQRPLIWIVQEDSTGLMRKAVTGVVGGGFFGVPGYYAPQEWANIQVAG
jgi:peptide/nickel transport system substrate-binding protein